LAKGSQGKERGASHDVGNSGSGWGPSEHKHRMHEADSRKRSGSWEHGYAAEFL